MLALLRDGTYIRYWLAVVVSFLGDAIARITLVYVAGTTTDAPVIFIALVFVVQLLPTGILGAFIGPLADRMSKRTLLISSDLARVVIVLAMIPAIGNMWLLLALILLEGVGKAFFETARMAAIPQLVGRHDIATAVALFQATNHTLNLIGPAFGGLLLAVGSVPFVLAIDAATFVVSALLLGSIAVLGQVPVQPVDRPPYLRSLRDGLRGVMIIPSLRTLSVALVPVMLIAGLFTANVNAQLLSDFRLSAIEYGLANAMIGGGAILAALLGPAVIRVIPSPRNIFVTTILLFGVSLIALAPAVWLWDRVGMPAVGIWCLIAGLGSSLVLVPIANTLLGDLPEQFRGRGVGLFNTVIVNVNIIGMLLGGLLAEAAGVAVSIIVGGAILLVAAAGLYVRPGP